VATVSAAAVWFAPRFTRRLPSLLVGLATGTAIYYFVGLFASTGATGPVIGSVAPFSIGADRLVSAWGPVTPSWLVEMSFRVLPYAGLLALEGSLEMAITSRDVTTVTGFRPDVHRGLVGQGLANVLSGMLAGLPVAPSHSQSMAAARTGAAAHAPAMSAVILLAGFIAFAGFLAYFPTAVLAGLLVTVGISTIDHWTRGLIGQVVRARGVHSEILMNLAMVAAVSGSFFFGGVPLALLVGTVLAMVVLTRNLAAATNFTPRNGKTYSSTRVWPTLQASWLSQARSLVRILRPRGGLFFGTAEQLAVQLATLHPPVKYCIIDCSRLTVLDATGCQIIAESAKQLSQRGITTVLAGLDPANPRDHALVALGLTAPAADRHWFRNLDVALEAVETALLHDQWPGVATDAPVSLGENELAAGLTQSELEVLSSHLHAVDCQNGEVLFDRGADSSALYVIERGLIEIHTVVEGGGKNGERLAVFGPGCLFGEISMLTGRSRSAGAVCAEPARLYVLPRAALQELQARFPVIYGKLIANLSLHLATRVVETTEIIRRK